MVIASAFLMIGLALVGLEEFDITNCVNCDWAEFWPLLCFSLHFAIVSAISWVCISLVAGRELTSLIG